MFFAEKEMNPKEVLVSLIYGESFPPKRIEDNCSQFEKEKYKDWNTIQILRQMFLSGNQKVTIEEIKHFEEYFEKRYGETVDDYKGDKNEII